MEIRVGENESLESALKQFKRKCARSGVLAEVRRREHYENRASSARRRRKPRESGSIDRTKSLKGRANCTPLSFHRAQARCVIWFFFRRPWHILSMEWRSGC